MTFLGVDRYVTSYLPHNREFPLGSKDAIKLVNLWLSYLWLSCISFIVEL